jgi:hypothetical protein
VQIIYNNGSPFFKTQGDTNNTMDDWQLPPGQISGKLLFSLPLIGFLAAGVRTKSGFLVLIGIPMIYFCFMQIKKIGEGVFEEIKKLHSHTISSAKSNQTLALFVCSMAGGYLAFCGIQSAHAVFNSTATAGSIFTTTTVFPSPSVSPAPLADHIVINEMYYDVDQLHGWDNWVDEALKIEATISTNNPNSKNKIMINNTTSCKRVLENITISEITILANSKSGDNQGTVNTSNAHNDADITIGNGTQKAQDLCANNTKNNEWIELYNPTTETVNLKNWTLTDNSGMSVTIPGSRKLEPHTFALISKNEATWSFWTTPAGVMKIPLGTQIGNGLDNGGDHLILENEYGKIIDAVSYGNDHSQFILSGVAEGHSLSRSPGGIDTDTNSDWTDLLTPTPGL